MKNNKGFTLIELIAAITILGIIMLVAIPNIMSVSIKNKNRTYLNDANKLVTLVKYRFESDATIDKPTGNKCLRIKLDQLDQTELQKGPENGKYDVNNSFVVVKYNSTDKTYDYYVQIKEVYDDNTKTRGIPITKYDNILGSSDKNNLISQTFTKTFDSPDVSGCTSWVTITEN